ncbi:transmembrane sensor [Sphingomonas zeicaulis]|uniref:FecR family protein n=1 Tax=Sphingomonas zeicaulis TaxID=1632740 RepID=UPI003D1A2DBE
MPASDKTRLREAAEWFAAQHGPDAAATQAQFETWLAASERNREAYSRIAETFSLGKKLKPGGAAVPAAQPPTRRRARRTVAAAALGVAAVGAVLLLVAPNLSTRPSSPAQPVAAAQPLATPRGQIRPFRLADGSVVTLDTDSRIRVAFTLAGRDLWLERGRARFDVAHDGRPFTVRAAGGSIVARGTIFDVRLGAHRVGVSLLRGAVDVIAPRQGAAGPRIRRLRPGETVAIGSDGVVALAPAAAATVRQDAWPQSLLEFDEIRVGDLVAEANRYATTPLKLADPALAERRVSGTFRVGDAERLARRLAALLDAPVSRAADGHIALGEAAH